MASDEHQLMVKGIIDYFLEQDFKITNADYDEYDECYKIGRHAPDVIAYDSNTKTHHIGEAEICDSLNQEHTKEQFIDFSDADSNGIKSQFYPTVPKSCIDELEIILKELGLDQKNNVHQLNVK